MKVVVEVVKFFKSVLYCCIKIVEVVGVSFIDDLKVINIGVIEVVLQGLVGSIKGKLIFIVGGDVKGVDLNEFVLVLLVYVDVVIVLGKDG